MATHFPLLSYRFDTSTQIFHEPQDVHGGRKEGAINADYPP